MRDNYSDHLLVEAIGAATLDADNTPQTIDLQGYNSAVIALQVGIGGITFNATNKIEFKLTHSDDDTTYSDVTTDDMLGVTVTSGGIIKALVAAHAASAVYRFGYKGNRRYLRFLADFSGTHAAGTPIAAMVIKGHGYNKPEAAQA